MSAVPATHLLGAPPLTPGPAGDFQAFWYFTILGLGMAVLVSVVAVWVLRALRPMWRDGNRLMAVLIGSGVGFFCFLFLAMVLSALIGLTNHPTTPPPFGLGSSG